ncbi:MAG: helix-turn-helix domain-containing protein [Sphingopyxis sp.]|nr:helix-turn-helix domain-containing protein [Sphingopyxis sp.]
MIRESCLRRQCQPACFQQREIPERTWHVFSYPRERTSMNNVPPFLVEGDMRRKQSPVGSGHRGRITPHEFVERARVDAARGMLKASERALKAVAFDCGFGNADPMRAAFVQRLGVAPHQYRSSFRPGANAAHKLPQSEGVFAEPGGRKVPKGAVGDGAYLWPCFNRFS